MLGKKEGGGVFEGVDTPMHTELSIILKQTVGRLNM